MTQFAHLELLYKQFVNLTGEIHEMIEEEDYDSASVKLEDKNRLMTKIVLAKKTTQLTDEESVKLQLIENQIKESDGKVLNALKKLHSEIENELHQTNKKVQLNSAYSGDTHEQQGSLIDYTE